MAVFQKLNDEGKTVVLITHEADIAAARPAGRRVPGRTSSSRTAPVAGRRVVRRRRA